MKPFKENQNIDDNRMFHFSEVISIIFVTVVIAGFVIAILFF
jgi:hypothetical protein